MAGSDKFKSRQKKVSDDYDEDRTYIRKTAKKPTEYHGMEYYGPDGKVAGRAMSEQDVKDKRAWWDAPKTAPVSKTPAGPDKTAAKKPVKRDDAYWESYRKAMKASKK